MTCVRDFSAAAVNHRSDLMVVGALVVADPPVEQQPGEGRSLAASPPKQEKLLAEQRSTCEPRRPGRVSAVPGQIRRARRVGGSIEGVIAIESDSPIKSCWQSGLVSQSTR